MRMSGYCYFPLPGDLHYLFPKDGREVGGDDSDPHITLMYFPELQPGDIELIDQACRIFSKDMAPYKVKFGPTKSFPPTEEGLVPWYASIVGDELLGSRSKFIKVLNKLGMEPELRFPDYVPHATLEYLPPDEECEVELPAESFVLDSVEFNYKEKDE